MQAIKKFLKRNAPVFIFGLIIALVFLLIILTQPKDGSGTPSGFKRVEEEVFDREPKEPEPTEKPVEYAPQIPSPENKGKPYFYGEYDPNLRDKEGYPAPPTLGSTDVPATYSEEDGGVLRAMEVEKMKERTTPTKISFTAKGFSPADAKGYTGLTITWTNNTDKEIKIVEAVPKHEALKGGVVIKPGESFSFRPLVNRLFTYVEDYSKTYGTVMVEDVTRPLLEGFQPGM